MDMVATNGGRTAAVPPPNPSGGVGARSSGRLARRKRSVWLIRNRPSVVTITGPSCRVTRVRGTSTGSPGQVPNDRSGRSTAWNELCAKRTANGCVSANAAAASSSSHIANNTARRSPGGVLLASGTAAATSSHRNPGTSLGFGRRRSVRRVDRAPMLPTSIVAIIEPSSVDEVLAEKRELGGHRVVVRVQEGRIVPTGKHDELCATRPFRHLDRRRGEGGRVAFARDNEQRTL